MKGETSFFTVIEEAELKGIFSSLGNMKLSNKCSNEETIANLCKYSVTN